MVWVFFLVGVFFLVWVFFLVGVFFLVWVFFFRSNAGPAEFPSWTSSTIPEPFRRGDDLDARFPLARGIGAEIDGHDRVLGSERHRRSEDRRRCEVVEDEHAVDCLRALLLVHVGPELREPAIHVCLGRSVFQDLRLNDRGADLVVAAHIGFGPSELRSVGENISLNKEPA